MRALGLTMLCVILIPVVSYAIPVQVPYSGQLAENGVLVHGTKTMQFSLYAAPTGGSPLATQTVLSENAPPASPTDQIRSNESMGPQQARTFSPTQVFSATAGHHTYGLYVRQLTGLTGGVPTGFTRATLQGMWLPRRYP